MKCRSASLNRVRSWACIAWFISFAGCTTAPAPGSALEESHVSTCSHGRAEQGCSCTDGAVESCFLSDTRLPDARVMCTEGTRTCRDETWSACEQTHSYLAPTQADTQQVVDPNAGDPTCSICDVLCFKVIDNLTVDGGTADGSVTFGAGGGINLLAIDAAVGGDAGGSNSPGTDITGPLTGCTPDAGPDTDCDGIPNEVDGTNGPPFSDTDVQTIFHQLPIGASGSDGIDISYKLNSADIYILFDATGTMEPARQNLQTLLTSTDVVRCAQLSQCCNGNTTCSNIVSAGNASNCYSAQPTYCGSHVDCADVDFDGAPNNELATQGVLGGIRCLIGNAQFGLGQFRELPVHSEPEQIPCLAEGCRYGDRDEQLFHHLVDMTSDNTRIASALSGITVNYNWDEPEGGMLALNSIATGHGHYFGTDRPAVPDRSLGQDCPADTFGYPCFRKDAVPIVIMFTDAPQHNGPGTSASDPSNCYGRGAGCPYSDLTVSQMYTSSPKDAAPDMTAHWVPVSSEKASSALDLGDVRGTYLSMVGDTTSMNSDYAGSVVGCGTQDGAPDAVIKFTVSNGMPVAVNFHLTKDDAYSSSTYGEWVPWSLTPGTDDPTPATEFGAVVSVFSGSPDMSGNTPVKCQADPQPTTVHGSSWPYNGFDFTQSLNKGTYYAVVKGTKSTQHGRFQLQIGDPAALVKTQYSPPLWAATRLELIKAGVRVLPVLATGGVASTFVPTAEAQASLLAQASGAVRADGTPIWYRITNDGAQTGQAVVSSVADLSDNLAMNVTLTAIDGPDPGASLFGISVTPQNSAGCLTPHPLVGSDGTCTDTSPVYDCNTQYQCRPGATPKFTVTFTNPASAPVPPNPSNPYGGYLFKLQLKSNKKYLLTEIPVFLIPGTAMLPPPPTHYQATGEYQQDVDAKNCSRTPGVDAGSITEANNLPAWGDLYYQAQLPEGTSIDFQLCTAATPAGLDACDWSTRKRATLSAAGSCSSDADCASGTGVCASGICQFIAPSKIWPDRTCSGDAQCPNGPLGAGDTVVKSRCQTQMTAPNFGKCLGVSQPLDLGATLNDGEDGLSYSRVHVTLHSDALQGATPQLFSWYLTYSCHAAL